MEKKTCIILRTTGTIIEKSIKSNLNINNIALHDIKNLFKKFGTNKIERQCDYCLDSYNISIFGWKSGKAGYENKTELPPPEDTDIYFGDILVIKSVSKTNNEQERDIVSLNKKEYNEFIEKAFGGFESLGDSDTDSDIKNDKYDSDDSFIVNSDEIENIDQISEEEEEFISDDETSEEEHFSLGSDSDEFDSNNKTSGDSNNNFNSGDKKLDENLSLGSDSDESDSSNKTSGDSNNDNLSLGSNSDESDSSNKTSGNSNIDNSNSDDTHTSIDISKSNKIWNEMDDIQLKQSIENYGENNWNNILQGVRRCFNLEDVQKRWNEIKSNK
jgi:hypothetical protein